MKLFQGPRIAAVLFALLPTTLLAAEVTELKLTKDEVGNRFIRDAKGTKWALYQHNGYRIVTHCGLKAGSKGPSIEWDYAPLDTGGGVAGYIESEDQCHRLMGHQKPNPALAGKILRGPSGDYNFYIDAQGNKHSIHSKTPVWTQCGVGNIKSQLASFDSIFRISGNNVISDVKSCVAVAGPFKK